jgi:hypothetical protein
MRSWNLRLKKARVKTAASIPRQIFAAVSSARRTIELSENKCEG